MIKTLITRCARRALLVFSLALLALPAQATIVQFQTVLGDFEVNLFDNITPETVANFLAYVEAGDFTDSFVHRSVPGFVVQGGGYLYQRDNEEQPFKAITTLPPVVNEPFLANRRGTIAMAKIGGRPNSATSQWFFNLTDNSRSLDRDNGGFTVFGQVMGDGMEILEAIAALPRFSLGGPLGELPLRDYGQTQIDNEEPVTDDHLVMIQAVVVIDADPNTADELTPDLNTRPSGGSGSVGWGLLLLLGLLPLRRSVRRDALA